MANLTQVFINDTEIDLSSDSPIALTFQINDLGEVRNQQGNTSNQFKVPYTKKNAKTLGFPENLNFNDPNQNIQLPYTKYQVRVIQNNIEILPNAIAELGDPAFDTDGFNITILSGNVDFFDQLGGQLSDMGDSTSQWSDFGAKLVWPPYDHVWNLQNVANSQKNTQNSGNNGIGGWIYPVVDYGLFTDDFTQRIDVRFQRPGFFIKTAIDLLLKFTGYKASGQLLKNPLYPKLIAQFSNSSWEHGLDYQNQPDLRGISVSNQNKLQAFHLSSANPIQSFNWYTIDSDPSNQFKVNVIYVSNTINSVKVTVTFPHVLLYGRVTPVEDSSKLRTYIYYRDPNYPSTPDTVLAEYDFTFDGHSEKFDDNRPGSDPNGWKRISGSGGDIVGQMEFFNVILSAETQLPANGKIFIGYDWGGLWLAYAYVYPSPTFVVKSEDDNVQFGQTVQCEKIFSDMSQKDLLKDTLQRFGIICQTDDYSATINFASLGEIVNNIAIAKDWTGKCVNQGKQVSLKLGDYSQVNYLEYQVDPNGGLTEIPLKYAWSQINIKDQTLPTLASDLIVSVFGASLNRAYYGDSVALIQMIDPTDDNRDFSISVAPRILIDQKLDLIALGKTVIFTDDPTSDPGDPAHNIAINDIISVPYFWKPGVDKTMSLLWEDLRLLYYPELEKILQNCKKITRYFILTARDISELDLLIPIYLEQESAYFYINKLDSWIENVPVKIDLVKIG